MFGAACGMELLSDASDKAKLLPFLEALDASPKALHRPVCRGWVGDWQISGKTGHVLAGGSAFLLYATTPEIDRIDSDGKRRCYGSPRRWGNIKAQLCFAVLTQEGDDEGIYRLERLPSEAEAGVIRDCLGIRRKRKVTAETLQRLERARSLLNRPLAANSSLESTGASS